jgi:N utilization substance protein A
MRGSRIQSIVRELNGEKIDIINFSDQPEILLARAIAPAKPLNLFLDEEKPYAVMVFDDDELAIAIGRNGQNISLASDVTGYIIDAISKSDYNKQHGIVDENDLSTIKGFSAKLLEILNENEISTCDDFLEKKDQILDLKGFGEKSYEKLATKIKEHQVDA